MADFKRNPLWGYSPEKYRTQSWAGDVSDNLSLVYAPLGNKLTNFAFPKEEGFKVTTDKLQGYPMAIWEDLYDTHSQAEFDNTVHMYNKMSEIRDRLSINNSISAMLMAGILDPINLIPIPTAIGMGFVRSAKRAIPTIAGVTAVQETWRADRDPTHTPEEAVYAITGSAFFGGLLTGTIGHLTRNLPNGKIGEAYHQAQLYDEGNPASKIKTKKTNGNAKAEEVNDVEFPAPLKISWRETLGLGRPKNVKKPAGDVPKGKGAKDEGEKLAPAFGYEATANLTLLGRLMQRYASPVSSRNAQKLASDNGTITRNVKAGGVAIDGKGSVRLNEAKWIHARATIIRNIQDDWTKYAGGLSGEPRRVLGMPTTKWAEQIKQTLDGKKNEKLNFETYSREVFNAIALASKQNRRVGNKQLDYGDIVHDIPEIQNTARIINKEFEKAGIEGEQLGLFRKEDGIEQEWTNIYKEYNSYWFQYLRFKNVKNPTTHDRFMMALQEKYMKQSLNDMEELEIYMANRLEAKERASAKMEEILDDIAERKVELQEKYDSIIDDEIQRKVNANEKIEGISEHILESIENQKRILSQLDQDYHTVGLSKKQMAYRQILIRRLYEVYGGLRSADKEVQPNVIKGATKKQQDFLEDLYKQLTAPRTAKKQNYLDSLLKKINKPASDAQEKYLLNLQKTITDTHFTKSSLMPSNEAHYLTRVWNDGAIRDNYDMFVERVMIPYVMNNPRGKLRFLLETKPKRNSTKQEIDNLQAKKDEAINKKAKEITNKLINESGDTNYDNMNGKGIARFFMKRDLDIENFKLLKQENGIADFIETDVRAITSAYFTKFGPLAEMARMFDGDRHGERMIRESIYDVALRSADEINSGKQKKFMKELAKHEDDFKILRDAVLGRIGNPATNGSASNMLIRVGMQLAQLTMMGKATIASLADPAKIILARGFGDTFGRYFKSWAKDLGERDMMRMAKQDLEVTGEALNVILNTARYRIMQADAMGNYGNRKFGKLGDKALGAIDEMATGFYNMNLLNSWTDTFKGWVGVMSADRIIRTGHQLTKRNGTPNKWDLDILRQYGLNADDLKQIYREWRKVGGEKTARGKEIYYSNVQKWKNADPDLVRKYTVAVRADQINTIITPTDADKPALMYGIVGRGAQQRQHNLFKMPLQFMAWSFGANNKIIMSSLQGRHKGQLSGMTAMLALGFMSDYIRNPSYWQQKEWQEKLIKGVEYSGLTSYWLDISNAIEIMTNNQFGMRPMLGAENPFADDLGDRISEPFGPLGSMSADVIAMLTDSNLSDNRRASIIRRLVPYNNLFYADWLFKGAQRTIMDND